MQKIRSKVPGIKYDVAGASQPDSAARAAIVEYSEDGQYDGAHPRPRKRRQVRSPGSQQGLAAVVPSEMSPSVLDREQQGRMRGRPSGGYVSTPANASANQPAKASRTERKAAGSITIDRAASTYRAGEPVRTGSVPPYKLNAAVDERILQLIFSASPFVAAVPPLLRSTSLPSFFSFAPRPVDNRPASICTSTSGRPTTRLAHRSTPVAPYVAAAGDDDRAPNGALASRDT